MQCVALVVIGANTTWVAMAEILICDNLKSGALKRKRKRWSPNEALLLHADVCTKSNMVNCILKSWHLVDGRLRFEHSYDSILGHLTIVQLMELMIVAREGVGDRQPDILAYTRAHNISRGDRLVGGR